MHVDRYLNGPVAYYQSRASIQGVMLVMPLKTTAIVLRVLRGLTEAVLFFAQDRKLACHHALVH
jgi:hypothetical protein